MNISIKNVEGTVIYSLEVNPTDTIASVKENIKMKEGIYVDEQVLIFNKMVLGDSSTLFDFRINSKSTLTLIQMSRGFMKIFINIKAKIQDKVLILCDKQELIFNEMVLHDINIKGDLGFYVVYGIRGFDKCVSVILNPNLFFLIFLRYNTHQRLR
ncbi:putative Ubiquitin-like domain-containing protein [Helianthus annuus]|uniref:Putative ubiquitin n=1 Tax=Helianthus annuus TaxID=4232 RepID=A0A251VRE9_HELAN|nr:putative Ubiquitin domain-containing protein [Helianthus annuus]KAJ0612860.1 putative Ubiquitin-like domain-containing protein [Helianthus annuus]KAJ0628247.1 putative Ubiquitin-like domain-containing protein [Helianthus annuus]KAJ0949580.1 putative Ubiquitin-like domain-containing protein [Helianthus annuus]